MLLAVSPRSWQGQVGPVVSDLAPGRPGLAETWAYLLSQLGFTDIASFAGPAGSGLGRVTADEPSAAVLNDVVERLEPSVSGPDAFCVVATKLHPVPGAIQGWVHRCIHREIDSGRQDCRSVIRVTSLVRPGMSPTR